MPLDELLSECLPRVFRFALRLTGDRHEAEDLTQEAFLRAWKQRVGLQSERAARVWMFRIAANLWRDWGRRARHPVSRPQRLQESSVGPFPCPEKIVGKREELDQALAALDSLPPRQRDVLYLSAVEELSLSDVAEVLTISRNAAKVSLCLARKRMRSLIEESVEETR